MALVVSDAGLSEQIISTEPSTSHWEPSHQCLVFRHALNANGQRNGDNRRGVLQGMEATAIPMAA